MEMALILHQLQIRLEHFWILRKNVLSNELQIPVVKRGKAVFLSLHLQIRHYGEPAI